MIQNECPYGNQVLTTWHSYDWNTPNCFICYHLLKTHYQLPYEVLKILFCSRYFTWILRWLLLSIICTFQEYTFDKMPYKLLLENLLEKEEIYYLKRYFLHAINIKKNKREKSLINNK